MKAAEAAETNMSCSTDKKKTQTKIKGEARNHNCTYTSSTPSTGTDADERETTGISANLFEAAWAMDENQDTTATNGTDCSPDTPGAVTSNPPNETQIRLTNLQYMVDRLVKRSRSLEKEKCKYESRSSELSKKVSEQQNELEQLQQQDKENQCLLSEIRETNASLIVEIHQLEGQFERSQVEKDVLVEQFAKRMHKLKQENKELKGCKEEAISLRKQLAFASKTHEKELRELQTAHSALIQAFDELHENHNASQKEVEKKGEELGKLRKVLQQRHLQVKHLSSRNLQGNNGGGVNDNRSSNDDSIDDDSDSDRDHDRDHNGKGKSNRQQPQSIQRHLNTPKKQYQDKCEKCDSLHVQLGKREKEIAILRGEIADLKEANELLSKRKKGEEVTRIRLAQHGSERVMTSFEEKNDDIMQERLEEMKEFTGPVGSHHSRTNLSTFSNHYGTDDDGSGDRNILIDTIEHAAAIRRPKRGSSSLHSNNESPELVSPRKKQWEHNFRRDDIPTDDQIDDDFQELNYIEETFGGNPMINTNAENSIVYFDGFRARRGSSMLSSVGRRSTEHSSLQGRRSVTSSVGNKNGSGNVSSDLVKDSSRRSSLLRYPSRPSSRFSINQTIQDCNNEEGADGVDVEDIAPVRRSSRRGRVSLSGYLIRSDPVLSMVKSLRESEHHSSDERGISETASAKEIDDYIERRFSMESIGGGGPDNAPTDQRLEASMQGSLSQILKKSTTSSGNGSSSKFMSRSGSSLTENLNASLRIAMRANLKNETISNSSHHRSVTLDNGDAIHLAESPIVFGLGKKKQNRYAISLAPTLLDAMNASKNLIGRRSSAASEGNGENENDAKVLSIINTMSLMMQKKTLTAAMHQHDAARTAHVPFELFFLLSKNIHIAREQLRTQSNFLDHGSWYLDPFTFKYADVLDTFSAIDKKDKLDPAELSAFCCPDGVKMRLVPTAGLVGAKHQGWKGKLSPHYKILTFTDADGDTTNAVAISVYEEVNTESSREMKDFANALKEQRATRAAARIIGRWWRKVIPSRRPKKIERRSTLSSSFTAFKSLFKSDSDSSASSLSCEGFGVSDEAKKLGKESFKEMNKASKLGDTLIVEKCYVMVGGARSELILNLRLLREMILQEHEEVAKQSASRRGSASSDEEGLAGKLKGGRTGKLKKSFSLKKVFKGLVRSEHKDNVALQKDVIEFRHKYLSVLREKMILSPDQRRIQNMQSRHMFPPQDAAFAIDVPTFSSGTKKVEVSLPLPKVVEHWGVQALLARIDAIDLLHVLMLLMIERSILIVGEASHLVTSCACALLSLLAPYEWPSNFMPLLPNDMIDFVSSPVPFLIGMVVDDKEHSVAIEEDERVVEAMKEGLTVINLSTNKVKMTSESDIIEMLKGCPTPKQQLKVYEKRLRTLQTTSPPLKSFSRFIDTGLAPHEVFTIDAIREVISEFLTSLADNIAKHPEGWRHYGARSEDGKAFDFYPSLFVDRQRKYLKLLENRLQFQEMMAYSQLFVEFVDSQRKKSLLKANMGKIIANWIYHRLQMRKVIKKRGSLDALKIML